MIRGNLFLWWGFFGFCTSILHHLWEILLPSGEQKEWNFYWAKPRFVCSNYQVFFTQIDSHQSECCPQSFNNAEMCVKSNHKFQFNAQRLLGRNQMNVCKEKVRHTHKILSYLFIYGSYRREPYRTNIQLKLKQSSLLVIKKGMLGHEIVLSRVLRWVSNGFVLACNGPECFFWPKLSKISSKSILSESFKIKSSRIDWFNPKNSNQFMCFPKRVGAKLIIILFVYSFSKQSNRPHTHVR